jgi:hypothetical protein
LTPSRTGVVALPRRAARRALVAVGAVEALHAADAAAD